MSLIVRGIRNVPAPVVKQSIVAEPIDERYECTVREVRNKGFSFRLWDDTDGRWWNVANAEWAQTIWTSFLSQERVTVGVRGSEVTGVAPGEKK